MSESMREIKDSVLSTVTVENFVEELASGPIERLLEDVANQQWIVELNKTTDIEDGEDYLELTIWFSPYFNRKLRPKKIHATYSISIVNKIHEDWETLKCSDSFGPEEQIGWDDFVDWDYLVDEEMGFLADGALTVQVEIRADLIIDKNGISLFNCYDPFEGCVKFEKRCRKKTFYAKKALIMHHSPVLANEIANGKEEFECSSCSNTQQFEMFLQLIHGVNAKIIPKDYMGSVLKYARDYGANDIIRRCETFFREKSVLNIPNEFTQDHVKYSLRTVKSVKELKEVARRYNEHPLDTEMMKAIVREFFSYAVDFREGPMFLSE